MAREELGIDPDDQWVAGEVAFFDDLLVAGWSTHSGRDPQYRLVDHG